MPDIQEPNEVRRADVEVDPLIVIASNRGPFSFRLRKDGGFSTQRGAGGLVTALSAIAENYDVLWVAAALNKGDELWAQQREGAAAEVENITLRLIHVARARYEQYYNVISNPLLWFIQHQLWDIPRHPSITRKTMDAWAKGYVAVNKQMADSVADSLPDTTRPILIMPQDYQLYLLPHFLRKRLGFEVQIQPFIHIPWPGPDAWRVLPEAMRTAILTSLLESDRIGFQTKTDAFNFVQTCRFYLPDAHSHGSRDTIHYRDRTVKACAYPISIDVEKVESLAASPQADLYKAQIAGFAGDRKLILRIDRVEPSKNILRGLQAYRALLEDYPEHRRRVAMLALLVPSRMEVDEYQSYLQEIMAEAGLINAAYNDGVWEPVRIILGDNYQRAIAAMQLYDVLLVNPIADGMNLVAKEGVLVNQRDGVLVLSEYAGAFYELGEHATAVSPFDIYSTAKALHQALTLPSEEKHQKAAALREIVRKSDIRQWFALQLDDALKAFGALRAFSSQARKDSTPTTP